VGGGIAGTKGYECHELGHLFIRDFQYGPIAAPMAASTEPTVPSVSSSTLPDTAK
jgi:hypothetical protein